MMGPRLGTALGAPEEHPCSLAATQRPVRPAVVSDSHNCVPGSIRAQTVVTDTHSSKMPDVQQRHTGAHGGTAAWTETGRIDAVWRRTLRDPRGSSQHV